MEGVKRITVLINNEKLCRVRAPYLFKDLVKVLESYNLIFKEKIDVVYQKRKEKIADDNGYRLALEKCGFEGLTINFTKPSQNSAKSSVKDINLPKKRQPTTPKSPKPAKQAKTVTPGTSRSVSSKKSSSSKPRSKSFPTKRLSSGHSSPSHAKITPSKSPSRDSLDKPAKKASSNSSSPVKKSPKSAKSPARQIPSLQSTPPMKLQKSPLKTPANSTSPLFSSTPSPGLSKSAKKPLRSTPSPSKPSSSPVSITAIQPSKPLLLSASTSLIQPVQQEVDILSAFAFIPDEGQLKVISEDGSKSRTIHEFSIKRSSRLLLTPDGIMITGGSGAPYQVYMLKSDYSVVPLVSMNHPRFWHCMGYIDGHPAVVNGAERSKIPKLFLNYVEVYKDGNWVDYPSTNCARASCSMTSNDGQVFLTGGVQTDGKVNSVVNIIEKWENGTWAVLDVKLRTCLISPGSFNVSDKKILIFGGEITGGSFKLDVYAIDLNTQEIKECRSLPRGSKFTYGQQSRITAEGLKVCDCFGNIMNIDVSF